MQDQTENHPPWYRQFWPWVLIAIPASAVVMGGITLWLALSNPEYLVVDEQEYDRIRGELRAGKVPATAADSEAAGDDDQP